jgi:hypothetical protein
MRHFSPRLPRLVDHHDSMRRLMAYLAALLQRLRSLRQHRHLRGGRDVVRI